MIMLTKQLFGSGKKMGEMAGKNVWELWKIAHDCPHLAGASDFLDSVF